MKNYSALIVAAGRASRSQLTYNKVFHYLEKEKMSVLEKSLSLFLNDSACKQIIVVLSKEDIKAYEKLLLPAHIHVVWGGQSRQESVMNGLQKVTQDYVFIHDGARPFLSLRDLNQLKQALLNHEALLLAAPVVDTIKHLHQNTIKLTYPRKNLCRALTPQVFKTQLIKEAYQKISCLKLLVSDDCSALELTSSTPIHVVWAKDDNPKLTYPHDFSVK